MQPVDTTAAGPRDSDVKATMPVGRARRRSSTGIVAAAVVLLVLAVGASALTPGSARLLIDADAPSGIHPATIGFGGTIRVGRHGCITAGGAVLVAPQGSSVSLDGRHITLAGIGTYAVGDELPQLPGLRTEPLRSSSLSAARRPCGPGTFETVWQ